MFHQHMSNMQTPQRSRYSRGGSRGRGRGRGRARSDSKGGPGRTGHQRGLFDGIWHCDCDPRLPAEQFKVKKEGPNKGRDFYTCQQSEPKRCGFFLWADEARPREAACLLSNTRKEKHPRNDEVQEGWSAGRRDRTVRFASPTPSPTPAARTADRVAGVKRTLHEAGFDEDDDDEYGLTREDEEELAQVADASIFQTPQKPQTNIGVYATPSSEGAGGKQRTPRRLPWLEEAVTPVSTKKSIGEYFSTPCKQPEIIEETKTATATYPELPSTPSPRGVAFADHPSPTPAARFTDSLVNSTKDTLTNEVLQELSSIQLPKPTIDRLRSILTKHDLRTQGIKMGRDVSRSALKAKEEKVKQLEERIRILEKERHTKDKKGKRQDIAVYEDDGEETDVEL